jgi:methylenetetrahydrofolate reductase (NADPH)
MHFYTLNLERTVLGILEGLELTPSSQCSPGTLAARQFPWQRQRSGESVRPVFWSNRPHSYCARTSTWDDFPNGRWTNSRSPAFGELRDYHLVSVHASPLNRSECRRAWGENPTTEADVAAIFIKFLEGEISALPWMTGPLAPESRAILAPLVALNEKGFLTINSQPRVNGAPSSDPAFGWGGPHGRVFQKAYLEFFVAPEKMEMLQVAFAAHARLSWQAVNADGDFRTNARGVNALTWGVFPGKEILQPTVVDAEAFLAWKDEAFGLWQTRWRVLYDESSESYALIERIASTYYLVNLVDNDYMVEDDLMSRVLLSL